MTERVVPEFFGPALISKEEIDRRIQELATEIGGVYRKTPPVLLGVLKGAVHFLSDLSRALGIEHDTQFIRVSTYTDGVFPDPAPRIEVWSGLDLRGRDLLIVDDILDRGLTVRAVASFVASHSPASVRWAMFLVKEGAPGKVGFQPDFIGFSIPDVWVVGYGMDHNERFRHLPGIWELPQQPIGDSTGPTGL